MNLLHKLTRQSITSKTLLIWWIFGTCCLATLFIPLYANKYNLISRLLLVLQGSILIVSILTYNIRNHISLYELFLSELCGVGVGILNPPEEFDITSLGNLNSEFMISIIGVFTATYLLIKQLKKNKLKMNINNIIQCRCTPFEVPNIIKLLILSCMVSVTISLTSMYTYTMNNVTIMSILFMLMPTFILLLSVVPLKETPYIRFIYYVIWVMYIQIAADKGISSLVSMIEPLIYCVTVVISLKTIKMEEVQNG